MRSPGKIPRNDLGQITTALPDRDSLGQEQLPHPRCRPCPRPRRACPAQPPRSLSPGRAPFPWLPLRLLPRGAARTHPSSATNTDARGYRSRKLRAERRHVVPPRVRPLTQGPPLIGPSETVTRMFTRTPGSPVQA